MSDLGDHSIAGAIGAAIGGAVVAVREFVSRKKRPSSPELPAEPSVASVRIGTLAQRVDSIEQEQTRMRHETAQRLSDLSESIEELKASSAVTAALIPRVESAISELAKELRQDRRRKE